MRREAQHEALHALPTKAARELRALLRPLDELYLARSIPTPETAPIRDLLVITPVRTRFEPPPEDTFTVAADLVPRG